MFRRLGENTNEFLRRYKHKERLDPEIESLVYALNDTGVLDTLYSCQGHFSLGGRSFCHHNQKAQVRFYVTNLPKAAALCDEILSNVLFDELDVTIFQCVVRGEDDFEIQWSLEYRPMRLWEMHPQDEGMYISMNANWTEEKIRNLLRRAFDKTIEICKAKRWDV